MNIREGMRRVGLVLGLIGFCVGCFGAYDHITPLLRQATEAREYQARLRVQGAESPKRGTGKYKLADAKPVAAAQDAVKLPPGSKYGGVPTSGRTAPSFWQYLPALAFPFLGFLLPWGTVKTLAWIGTGFMTGTAK